MALLCYLCSFVIHEKDSFIENPGKGYQYIVNSRAALHVHALRGGVYCNEDYFGYIHNKKTIIVVLLCYLCGIVIHEKDFFIEDSGKGYQYIVNSFEKTGNIGHCG